MANNVLNVQIKQKTDTEANWKSVDPVLLLGEIAISSDKRAFKIGDGSTKWSKLYYNNANNASSCTGNSATATTLATARTIQTNLSSTSTASFDGSANITPGITGTLPIFNGGTGHTNAKDGANYFINSLDTASATPTDNDYYISQYAGGGTTTTTYHRRSMTALWDYIKNKISSVLGLTASDYNGKAATTTKLATARTISNSGDLTGSYSFDGSKDITVDSYIYNCTASVNNTNNYPYHRIGKTDVITNNYEDNTALFYVTQDYVGGGFGLIRISIRTNSGSNVSTANAEWLIRKGLATDSIQVGLYNVNGATYADIFYKSNGTYAGFSVRALEGKRANIGRNKIVLVNSSEANNTTTSDAKTSTECYATIAAAGTAIHSQDYTNIVAGSDAGFVQSASLSDRAIKVKDSNNNKDISITYSKAAQTSTSWLASWNGYELGSISTSNILAGKASKDDKNQTISSTYIKNLSVNGQDITYTKGNDTTGKITMPSTGVKIVRWN